MANNHKDAIRAIREARKAGKGTDLLLSIVEHCPAAVSGSWAKLMAEEKKAMGNRSKLSICSGCIIKGGSKQ